jgi:DNA-binding MarR family transcriptional regulator
MALPSTWNLFGDDHIPHRLLLLARMIDRETSRQLQEECELSVAEWRVLAFVCASGPASASHIGTAGQIDRAEISRAVRKLAAADLISREPDGTHRKRRIIHPTESGKRLFKKVRDLRRSYFQTLMHGISADDRRRLDAMLETIARRFVTLPGGDSRSSRADAEAEATSAA